MTEAELVPATTLSALSVPELAQAIRPLWEDAGLLAEFLHGRLFATWHELVDAVEHQLAAAPEEWRAEVLWAHPRLGEDPDVLLARSRTSFAEQGGGVDLATAARLAELNDRYEARFGFPFVEWVAGRPLARIADVLEERLAGDRETELVKGSAALVAIARDRLDRIESTEGTPR